MKKFKNYIKLQGLLCIVLSFFIVLAFLIYQNTYKNTEISSKRYITNELRTNLERSVSLGKTYNNKFAFEQAIEQSLGDDLKRLGIRQILFINKKGDLLYRQEGRRYLNFKELIQLVYPNQNLEAVLENRGLVWINTNLRKFKLNNADSEITEDFGAFLIAYSDDAFSAPVLDFIKNFRLYFLLSYIIGSLLLIFALVSSKQKQCEVTKKKLFFSKPILFLAIIVAELTLALFLIMYFDRLFHDQAHETVEQTLEVESEKIQRLLGMGLPIYEFSRASSFYKNELAHNENIASLQILDAESSLVLDVDMQRKHNTIIKTYEKELIANDDTLIGKILISLGNNVIFQDRISAIADILTVFIISILVATEYIYFISLEKSKSKQLKSPDDEKQLIPIWYVRSAIAIFNFACSLSISFLPITMLKLTEDYGFFGMSPVVASSLPGSFEFAATLLSFLFVQRIYNKLGWQSAFFTGTVLYAIGSLASAFAFNPITLILARMICGFAFGFTWLATYYFVFSNVPNFKNRAFAFALISAGIYSGYLCGIITGGILSTQLSASVVFFVAALFAFAAMTFIIFYMYPYFNRKHKVIHKHPEHFIREELSAIQTTDKVAVSYLTYVKNKNILFAFLFILIPLSLVQVGLLNFGLQITLSNLDFSTSAISRAIISYGLVQIYIAPLLMNKLSNFQDKRLILLFGVLLVFVSLIVSSINVYTLLFSIFLFGIAGATIWPILSSFILNQDISGKLGILKAITAQRFADKMGQALGPVLYGAMFSVFTFSKTIVIISIIFLTFGVIFFFATKTTNSEIE